MLPELAMANQLLQLAIAGCAIDAGLSIYKYAKKTTKTGSAFKGDKKEIKKYLGINGIRLSKKIQLCENAMYEHIGIFGKTGSHKSSGIYIPNLLSNDLPKSSLVIPDVKGELYELTSAYQRDVCGREIVVYAPLNPEYSCGINPLEICKDITDVRKLAQTLVGNAALSFTTKTSAGAEWDTMATPLLTAALLYCKHVGGRECNITSALDLVITQSDLELEMLFSNSTSEIMDQWNIFKTCLDAKGTASSIRITLSSALQSFLDYKIAATTSKNEFRPEMLREKPIALYIIYSETKADYLAPVMATIFSQLIDNCLDYYDNDNNCLPVFNYYDEFANMGFLPGFNHIITAARSRTFSLNLCIHDVRQLFKLYGQDLTYTMLNNLTTKVVLPGISEPNTLNYISDLCGECEIRVQSESKSGDKTTITTSKQKKKLYTSNEVRCLKDDTCIIIVNNKQVVADNLNIYWKKPNKEMYEGRISKQYL